MNPTQLQSIQSHYSSKPSLNVSRSSPPSTSSSTSTNLNGKIQKLKQIYSNSANSFLFREYFSTLSLLDQAFDLIDNEVAGLEGVEGIGSGVNGREWFDFILLTGTSTSSSTTTVVPGSELNTGANQEAEEPVTITPEQEQIHQYRELIRKLLILKITFLATTYSNISSSSSNSPLSTLLSAKTASHLLTSIWISLLPNPTQNQSSEILPTPSANFLHPSLIVALTLAALKLDEPILAKRIVESWFGSLDEEVEVYLENYVEENEVDLIGVELYSGGSIGSGELPTVDLASSTASLITPSSSSRNFSTSTLSNPTNSLTMNLIKTYLKLVDLLSLHILPRLNEWESSVDFLKSQSRENGGWISSQRVELALTQLNSLQQQSISNALLALKREKEKSNSLALARSLQLESENLERSKLQSNGNGNGNGKGKGRSTNSNHSNSHSQSSSKRSPSSSTQPQSQSSSQAATSGIENNTGFAALRSTLSSYLSQPAPTATTTTTLTTNTSTSSSFLKFLQSFTKRLTTDPVRLLSIICFLVGFTSYLKSRRQRLLITASGSGNVAAGEGGGFRAGLRKMRNLVGETVRMGVKVSSL